MKWGAIFAIVVLVVLGALLTTAVFADEEDPTTPACATPGWWLEYVTTTYTGTHTVLELVLKQEDAQYGFSNVHWKEICFLCEKLDSVKYQTTQMVEQGLDSVPLSDAEIECEDDSRKIVLNKTFEPSEAPIKLWFDVSIASATPGQTYFAKWGGPGGGTECQGSIRWFNCGPPTAITLGTFAARPAQSTEWPFGKPWPALVLGLVIMTVGTGWVVVVLRRKGEH